jgi:O-antigen/teichoic acid export membrane protein
VSSPRGAGLQRHTLILITGALVQAVVAFVTVPLYLSVLGSERFGTYVLAGVIVAYFVLLERGVAVAIQNDVARLGEDAAGRSSALWTAVGLNLLVGTLGAIAFFVVGWVLFSYVLAVPDDMVHEAVQVVFVFAVGMPISTVAAVLLGALIGREHFVAVALLDTARGLGYQLLPLAFAAWIGPELVWPALGALTSITIATVAMLATCVIVALPTARWRRPTRKAARRLLHYGKWVTASAIIAPFIETSDRLLIGAFRGPSGVTVFSVPYNVATRLLVIPFNLSRVAFSRFSALGHEESQQLGASTAYGLAAVTAPLCVFGALVAGPFFGWWIGGDVGTDAAPIAAVIFAGVWINGLGYVANSLLLGQGRPDVPASIHALEVVPFVLVLLVAVYAGGPLAAAVVWTARVFVDTTLLMWVAKLPWLRSRRLVALLAVVVASAVAGALLASRGQLLVLVGGLILAASVVVAWTTVPRSLRDELPGMLGRSRRGVTPEGAAEVEPVPSRPLQD